MSDQPSETNSPDEEKTLHTVTVESLEPKIYLLPNLMTAGNLLCGFMAVLSIIQGIHYELQFEMNIPDISKELIYDHYQQAILYIFGSCLFDLLDGRLARIGGRESPFGREFDSIADVISFGMAPALLVSKTVLFNLPEEINWLGWAVAFSYLLCGAMRLARFNCLAVMPEDKDSNKDFLGIPIPMAAGFIASITYLLTNFYEGGKNIGGWNYVLVGVMLGLSILMISNIRYPSFKKVDFSTKGSVWGILIGALILGLLFNPVTRSYTPALIFSCYLLYGMIRPFFSKSLRKLLSDKIDG